MNSKQKKILDYLFHPRKVIFRIGIKGGFRFLNDETYLRLMYYCKLGKKLNLSTPQTYNEKLQWLKLNYRDPLHTMLVDKYEAKKCVAKIIGEEYIIPTLGVYDSFDEINFDALPNEFVLKCTHDSGGLVICKDKASLNIQKAKKKLNKSLKRNYYWAGREWAYRNVKPRIIAEKYMIDEASQSLRDYKFFCSDGCAKAMLIISDRENSSVETTGSFYDMEFRRLPFQIGRPYSEEELERPINFQKMKMLAEKLAQGIPHVRVDFYEVNGAIFIGEITFYHCSGLKPFEPEEWDRKFGEIINLPLNN